MKPKEIDLGFRIDENKVKRLDLPAEEILFSELIHNADFCYLEKEGTDDWNLSPNELIKNFDRETTHAKRVEAADLTYPIYIYKHLGSWIILDGVHRFTKAIMNGEKTILVKKVPQKFIDSIKKKKRSSRANI